MNHASIHLLRQMQKDSRLAWLIGPGSRSYELLTEEGALATGQDVETFRVSHEATLTFTPWPRSHEHITTTLNIDIDELLATRVQPGEELSIADLLTRFCLPFTLSAENAMRDALRRAGFTQVREATGFRRRLWVTPLTGHQGCLLAPHAAPDTPASPLLACHPQASTRVHQTPENPLPTAQLAQTESHQFSAASPPPVNDKDGSLAAQGGAA